VSVEQPRCDAGETAITGPIFGPKMTQTSGEPALREAALLAAQNVQLDDFKKFGKLTRGTRRAYLVRPQDLAVDQDAGGIRLQFTLPPGSYATSLLREFMKSD
jgi:tRNA pseudouridine13 synthase